eukprot:CAMPEP_0168484634 /NCGR_PEP_ID=MMETSP0228-20121227/66197_1 /TAXON_ID=133427 /ORGANISM="Protoceratium reticulatum, Strain CCCM 535 (=CCMP 1889)" /LENGTH=82 /DNA_ID=CAMNT_0008501177 /DNA_START=6 /DNA_END=250 /DNA_ORIENTATION=+
MSLNEFEAALSAVQAHVTGMYNQLQATNGQNEALREATRYGSYTCKRCVRQCDARLINADGTEHCAGDRESNDSTPRIAVAP